MNRDGSVFLGSARGSRALPQIAAERVMHL